MFAKENSSVQSAAGKKGKDVPLRKSDRRHLRDRVARTLWGQSVSDHPSDRSRLDVIFLQGTILQRSLVLPVERATLYLRSPSLLQDDDDDDDNELSSPWTWPYTTHAQVVWIEIDHGPHVKETTPIPTLALLSVLPVFVPTTNAAAPTLAHGLPLVTVPYQVTKYLCRGAHLMKAGMRSLINLDHTHSVAKSNANHAGSSSSSRMTVVGVVVEGNPQPVAVGWLTLSATTANNDFGPGHKGQGVHIVTAYGDDLWKQQLLLDHVPTQGSVVSPMGTLYDAGHYGNIGFVDGARVVPLVLSDGQPPDLTTDDDEEDEEASGDEAKVENNAAQPQGEGENEDQLNSAPEEPTAAGTENPPDTAETAGDATTTTTSPSPEKVLHEAVCRALVRLSPKRDLPLAVSIFYAQHVLPNRPAGTTIQLKQTRYKKFGAYLQAQVQQGLLQVGPDASKKDPLALLTGFNPRHDDLRPLTKEAREEKAETAKEEDARLVLLDLYVIPHHFVALLRLDKETVQAAHASSTERRNTGFLTNKEIRAILDDYVARENLIHPDRPAKVVLDGPLTAVLYKSKSKSATPTPLDLMRKQLVVAWQAKMEVAFALVQLPGSRILKMGRGKGPLVSMELTRRNNKKFLTKVRGMEDFGIAANDLQSQIAHRFGCAVGVEEDPHQKLPKNHVELVLQGNLVDEVEALLVGDASLTDHGGAKDSPYCIPANAVEVVLRKGVPARKKRPSAKGRR
jgi:translation initiation factor 2D